MSCLCRTFAEEQSLVFSVRLACRRVRTCTEGEQPRRKIVRCRQVTCTSRPHSKKVARAWLLLAEQMEWMDRQEETREGEACGSHRA
jgi:hypothetical protein